MNWAFVFHWLLTIAEILELTPDMEVEDSDLVSSTLDDC